MGFPTILLQIQLLDGKSQEIYIKGTFLSKESWSVCSGKLSCLLDEALDKQVSHQYSPRYDHLILRGKIVKGTCLSKKAAMSVPGKLSY